MTVVAPDGSPLAIYQAMPPGPVPALVHAAVRPGGTILELGSGPGRMTHPLVGRGHPVVAVDDSPAMLAAIDGAETVLADLHELRLDGDRRFDCVLAASHLINDPDPARRSSLLATCRHHVADDGVVLIQRYDPAWTETPTSGWGEVGPVEIDVEVHTHRPPDFDATITYTLGPHSWSQTITATAITDAQLATEAGTHDLALTRWLDPRHTWALLHPSAHSPSSVALRRMEP
jgi:SAM-dependent methyltransferase